MSERRSAADHARATDPRDREIRGMLRRLVVDRTTKAAWKLAGYTMLDGRPEVVNAEVFSGVGFYARPPEGVESEVVTAQVGGREQPIVIAARDEQTRAAVAGSLAADETAVFNTEAIVHLKADGTIEAKSVGGTAVPLATKADVQNLVDYIAALTLPVSGGSAGPPAVPPDDPDGTSKLKGE